MLDPDTLDRLRATAEAQRAQRQPWMLLTPELVLDLLDQSESRDERDARMLIKACEFAGVKLTLDPQGGLDVAGNWTPLIALKLRENSTAIVKELTDGNGAK
jgi:hypothetical protein